MTDPFDYLALALFTVCAIAFAALRRRCRRIDDRIERRVQQSIARLREPTSRFARPLPAQRADSTDAAIVKEAQIQVLQDFGREMRQVS